MFYLFWKCEEESYKVYYKIFYCVWKETSFKKPSKLATAKTFSPVCMLLIQLASVKVYYSKTFFFYKRFLIPWGLFNRHVLALFETSDLKEVIVLFFYLHNTSTVLIKTKIKSSKIKFLYIVLVKFFVLLLIFDAPLFPV